MCTCFLSCMRTRLEVCVNISVFSSSILHVFHSFCSSNVRHWLVVRQHDEMLDYCVLNFWINPISGKQTIALRRMTPFILLLDYQLNTWLRQWNCNVAGDMSIDWFGKIQLKLKLLFNSGGIFLRSLIYSLIRNILILSIRPDLLSLDHFTARKKSPGKICPDICRIGSAVASVSGFKLRPSSLCRSKFRREPADTRYVSLIKKRVRQNSLRSNGHVDRSHVCFGNVA